MNWKSMIITAVVTGIITIGTGMLLFWWQAKEPKLTYNYTKSIPFDDSENSVFIQQFEITNAGTQIAENVSLVITFPQSNIEKLKIKIDSTIKYNKKIEENSIALEIENLNPQEKLSLSLLIKSKSDSLADPTISLRGKGLIGEKVGNEKSLNNYLILGIALLSSYIGLIISLLISSKLKMKVILKRLLEGKNISGESQKNIIASLLSMYGLPTKAREYLNYGNKRLYWVEADLLAAEALNNNDDEKNKILRVLINLSEVEYIASSSKAIIFYNIARIYKSLNVENETTNYLSKAQDIDKKEIEKRLAKDPIFINNNDLNHALT